MLETPKTCFLTTIIILRTHKKIQHQHLKINIKSALIRACAFIRSNIKGIDSTRTMVNLLIALADRSPLSDSSEMDSRYPSNHDVT